MTATKTATKTVTLTDYANDRDNVVLFWAAVGTPLGDHTPLGYPDLDFADRQGLLDLTGTVDDAGDWLWDGEGEPTGYHANSITTLHAFVSAKRWNAIVEEYENNVG